MADGDPTETTPAAPTAPPQFVQQGQTLPPGQPGYHAYPQRLPSNNLAVASIITSCSSLGLLLISIGLFAPICAIASTVGCVLGHKGKVAVDEGRAAKQRDLSIAGFWVGVAGLILSLLAIVAWVLLVVVLQSLDWNEFGLTTAP